MLLSKDDRGGGSNPDGSSSTEFCSHCFQNGMFVHPEFTAVDMQNHCIEQLSKRGMPKFISWFFTRNIPKLGRWSEV